MFNFNFDKLPESPLFWLLVAIFIFIGLLATGHGGTALTLVSLSVGVVCVYSNVNSHSGTNSSLWIAAVVCLALALFFGFAFVGNEWSTTSN